MHRPINDQSRGKLGYGPTRAYTAAIAVFALALALRFGVDGYLPSGFPYLTFFPAVIITAFLFGTGPGILSAALGGLAAWYFFLPPFYSLHLTPTTGVALGFYVFIIGVDLLIIDRLLKALGQLDAERKHAMNVAEERDTLFREVQHRIGNNLQAISSLLLIQSRNVQDPAAHRALMESIQRVSVIADIQRMFHDPDRTKGQLDAAYAREIANGCIMAAGAEAEFKVEIDVEPITLEQDSFLAVSLVLTECINNALEHGKRPDGGSLITIGLQVDRAAESAILTVSDNGPGVKADFNSATSNSIGLRVVNSFCRQLNGTFSMENAAGTRCTLTFPLPARSD